MPYLKSNFLDYSTDKLEKLSTLVNLLHYRAQDQPEKKAYIFLQNGEIESGSLTYGELDRQARAIAAGLQSWQGERALLLYPSGLEFITAFFGCLYALDIHHLNCIVGLATEVNGQLTLFDRTQRVEQENNEQTLLTDMKNSN